MAQQVFPQWSPVVKAHNEDQQEVYIPAAIIHAQTRDGKDELIVGAANMQFDPETGDYLPTHAGNPVEVRARALETLLQTLGKEETLALVKAALDALVSKDFATQTTLAAVLEKLADLATESTLAQSVDKLNSILSRLEGKLDTAIFDSQGNPISAANRLPVEATLSGSSVPYTAPLYVNRPVRSQVQTLLNAVSVPAGGDTGWVNVSPDGARYIILLFNCDQPWRAWTNAPWSSATFEFLYPRRDDADQNPSPLVNYPARSVVVAPLPTGSVASIAEAFAVALPWSGLRVLISNKGAATATITLRVLRLFV